MNHKDENVPLRLRAQRYRSETVIAALTTIEQLQADLHPDYMKNEIALAESIINEFIRCDKDFDVVAVPFESGIDEYEYKMARTGLERVIKWAKEKWDD
jgi:hypothetical protein